MINGGKSLADWIEKEGKTKEATGGTIEPNKIVWFCTKLKELIQRAVIPLNEKGIMHNDLKADNILTRDGKMRIIDWGLSYVIPQDKDVIPYKATKAVVQFNLPPSNLLYSMYYNDVKKEEENKKNGNRKNRSYFLEACDLKTKDTIMKALKEFDKEEEGHKKWMCQKIFPKFFDEDPIFHPRNIRDPNFQTHIEDFYFIFLTNYLEPIFTQFDNIPTRGGAGSSNSSSSSSSSSSSDSSSEVISSDPPSTPPSNPGPAAAAAKDDAKKMELMVPIETDMLENPSIFYFMTTNYYKICDIYGVLSCFFDLMIYKHVLPSPVAREIKSLFRDYVWVNPFEMDVNRIYEHIDRISAAAGAAPSVPPAPSAPPMPPSAAVSLPGSSNAAERGSSIASTVTMPSSTDSSTRYSSLIFPYEVSSSRAIAEAKAARKNGGRSRQFTKRRRQRHSGRKKHNKSYRRRRH